MQKCIAKKIKEAAKLSNLLNWFEVRVQPLGFPVRPSGKVEMRVELSIYRVVPTYVRCFAAL
jgi:hypothetical protein